MGGKRKVRRKRLGKERKGAGGNKKTQVVCQSNKGIVCMFHKN